MTSVEEVREALKKCIDPELKMNIVDLGLVYGINVDQGKVKVTMTMTTPGCPLGPYFEKDIKEKLSEVPDVKQVEIEIVWDPPWNPNKMSQDAKQLLGFF